MSKGISICRRTLDKMISQGGIYGQPHRCDPNFRVDFR